MHNVKGSQGLGRSQMCVRFPPRLHMNRAYPGSVSFDGAADHHILHGTKVPLHAQPAESSTVMPEDSPRVAPGNLYGNGG
ncbi:hypothetical protein GCM10009784_15810 [Arthrobacter parietis]|uniref:Uncharacterized protein n=1 Tax=Arthrobacter parietis TaxID=271434 RepID=A0ABN3AUH8_9MICC